MMRFLDQNSSFFGSTSRYTNRRFLNIFFLFFSFTKTKPKKVGPAALVGGSAAIYTSLLQHPGSTLNQLSLILMMLLAVQYAVQPRLSRKYISPKVNKQSVALVEEVVKTGLAAVIFFLKPSTAVRSALKGKVVSLDGKKSMGIRFTVSRLRLL